MKHLYVKKKINEGLYNESYLRQFRLSFILNDNLLLELSRF